MTALFFLSSPAFTEDVYEWTDENGTVHFSDSPNDIPPKYQDQFKTRKFNEGKSQKKPKSATSNIISEEPVPNAKKEDQRINRYEIPFKGYEGSGKRIIISVTFNDSVTAPMLLDTGATGMLITPQLAEKLGVFEQDQARLLDEVNGVGSGSAPAIRTIIQKVEVGGAKDRFIPTAVLSRSLSKSFEGLIGMDFMSNYSISIDNKKKVVVLEEMPPDPDFPGGHDEEWWRTNFQQFGSARRAWKEYLEELDDEIRNSSVNLNISYDVKMLHTFAEYQYREADKLFDKLNEYARQYAVPMHWRRE